MMKLLFTLVITATLFACVSVKRSTVGRSSARDALTMVYGAGASTPHETERDLAEYWMSVYVTLPDSLWAFGYLDGREFELYCHGPEGSFRVRGGETRRFAIRDTLDMIYSPESMEFSGPKMQPSRAVFPPLDDPYYSIATLYFEVAGDSVVTAEIVASSPNGFTAAR